MLRALGPVQLLFARAMSSSSSRGLRKLEGKVAIVTASTDGYAHARWLTRGAGLVITAPSSPPPPPPPLPSIGYAIAHRLARDGAKVMVSSRKEENVQRAVQRLREEEGDSAVHGVVCHVGKEEHRKRLIQEVARGKEGGVGRMASLQ